MNNWTVIFLIRSVDEYWMHAINMIHEIVGCQKSEKVGIVFCITGRMQLFKILLPTKFGGPTRSDHARTTVFLKLNDLSAGSPEQRLTFVKEQSDFDMREPADVTGFFASAVLTESPASKYMLFTWDHGSVFGIFREEETIGGDSGYRFVRRMRRGLVQLLTKNKNEVIEVNKKGRAYEGILSTKYRFSISKRPISPQDGWAGKDSAEFQRQLTELDKRVSKEYNMLTAFELNNAMKATFGPRMGEKGGVDVVCMMNCCMQFFDTGLTLRESTNYLVAPETIMNFRGYNYVEIFKTLFKTPSLSSQELVSTIVSTFKTKQYESTELKNEAINKVGLFGNDLTNYETIAVLIDKIARILKTKLTTPEGALIRQVRAMCGIMPSSGKYKLIDCGTFVQMLGTAFPNDTALVALIHDLQKEMQTSTADRKYIGSEIEKSPDGLLIKPSGFSLYFPPKGSGANDFFITYIRENTGFSTRFSQEFQWDNFIYDFLE